MLATLTTFYLEDDGQIELANVRCISSRVADKNLTNVGLDVEANYRDGTEKFEVPLIFL